MNVSHRLVEILEENGIEHVFGIPGDQILPLYEALSNSTIKHILTKHEQAAAHAADAYSRASSNIGVCIATAGPGALNLVMGVAAAYKDSIPILVITGDNDLPIRDKNYFQSFPLRDIFENITVESYSPLNGTEAIYALKASLYALKNDPKGPIHINLSKDVLLFEEFTDFDLCYLCEADLSAIDEAQKFINNSKKTLFVLGSGAISQSEEIKLISKEYNIPITTTYNGRGIISEEDDLNLGILGIRSTPQALKAIGEADSVIALGSIASNRTFPNLDENKLIHVNIDKKVLKGKYQIQGTVKDFLLNINFKKQDWISDILSINNERYFEGVDDDLTPQAAIKRILNKFRDDIIVADAGSHTTWVSLMHKALKPNTLLFPAATAPMGYGLPAAIGASLGSDKQIIAINGDGDFQMNLQELATLKENNLDVIVFILNNSEYGIIRQWQEDFYEMKPYQVNLNNPDFLKLSAAYGIDSVRINNLSDLEYFLDPNLKGPLLVEVLVDKQNIPLPNTKN